MITVNESARDEVLKLLNAEGHPEGSFVRVGVKGGGCSLSLIHISEPTRRS